MRWSLYYTCMLALLVLLVACSSTSAPSNDGSQTQAAHESTTAPLGVKPQGKLSARLQQLSSPEFSTKDVQAQASALNLPASGPGSIQRNDRGELLVTVRVSDTSEANRAALQTAGATVMNVAAAFHTFTVYVRPEHLATVAALPVVERIQEELRP